MKALLTILLLITSNCVSQIRYDVKVDESLLKEFLSVAKSQVGLKELTGRNDGPHIEQYLRSVGLRGRHPYCAAGIYWCFKTASENLMLSSEVIPIKKSASANAIYDDARKKGTITLYLAKKGDLLVWKLAKSYSGHIEVIIKPISNGLYLTIGFNTGTGNNRDGQGNYYRYRSIYDSIGRLNVRGIVGFKYLNT